MAISVMLKPASSNCNMKCKYCFYHSLASNRSEYSKGMMSDETARRVADSALDFAKGTDVYFTFQGGEPLLLGVDFYSRFVDYVREKNVKNSNIHYCIQTNGTLINDEYADFFKKNGFLVGVSLDGDREINKYRVYADGKETFDDVLKGIEILKSHSVTFNILSVLTKNTANEFRKAYRFFKENDLRYLQFIPCLKPFEKVSDNYDESLYMTAEDYGEFLNRGFNIYFNTYMRGDFMFIRSFENYILLSKGRNAEQCGMNGCCSSQFVVEGDGSVYPCDFYCTDSWYLGNINDKSFDDLYHSDKAAEFIKNSFILDEKCKVCDYFSICRAGGCKRNRQSADYCQSYKSFFENSLDKINMINR